MIKIPVYSSRLVKIAWAGHTFLGLAPDSFIEIAPNTDETDEEVGADSGTAISMSPDFGGTVTIKLQQNSPSNQRLSAIVNAQKLSGRLVSTNMTIKDPSGSVIALLFDAHIKTSPTMTRGNTATGSSHDWVFYVQDMNIQAVPEGFADEASAIADAASIGQILTDFSL